MIAFSIGSLHIYRYGIMYAISLMMQIVRFQRLAKSSLIAQGFPRVHSLISKHFDTIFFLLVCAMILGARLGHVLIYDPGYYSQHIGEIFNLQAGGMSFVGGFIGVMCMVFALGRYYRLTFTDNLLIWDLICVILPFNIFLGRIGNWLNQELYGRVVDLSTWSASHIAQFSSWHLMTVYPHVDHLLRRNTNMMEALGEGLGVGILTLYVRYRCYYRRQARIQAGWITATFMIAYSIIRFVLEAYRDNPAYEFVWGYSKSQLWMILMLMVGIGLCLYLRYTQARHDC